MARGRIISRTLGTSRRFSELADRCGKLGEFAQALYPLVVVSTDDHGRMHGDAFTVKHAVWPTSHRGIGDFDKALDAMHAVGLIARYAVNDVMYLQIQGFDDHQTGLHKRRESKYPVNPGTPRNNPEKTGKNRTELRTEQEQEVEQEQELPLARRASDAEDFSRFWDAYPRKVGKDAAKLVWDRKKPDIALVLAALARTQWPDDEKYIPHPRKWLYDGRWQDETQPQRPTIATSKTAGNPAALAAFIARGQAS